MRNLATVEEACDLVTDGTHYTPKNAGSGVPFLTVKDVTDSALDFANCSLITNDDYRAAKAGNSAPQKGDVLFSKDGTVGKVHVVSTDKSFAVLSSLAILRPKHDRVDAVYLGHVLRSPKVLNDALKRKTGSAIRRIILSDLKRVQVPLPPLPEQRRIAEVLDRAEALRAKRRDALAQIDILTQAIFLDLFGDPTTNPRKWPKNFLRELVMEFRYGTSNKSQAHGKPALRIPNVVGGAINVSDLKLVPVDAAEFQRLKLTDGDVLFVRTNGNPEFVGRCAVFDRAIAATSGFPDEEFVFASYLIRARLRTDVISPIFLREFMLGTEGRKELRARSKTSAGQFNINTENLGSIPVIVPPLQLQHEFICHIAFVEKLKTAHRASLAELDALFATLQHRAFRGEL